MEDGANGLCEMCSAAEPIFCCGCDYRSIRLCPACKFIHIEKSPTLLHPIMPLAALSIGEIEYLRRSRDFVKASELLKENVYAIYQCIEDVNNSFYSIVSRLEQHKSGLVEKLTKLKDRLSTEIAEAIEEASQSLYKDRPQLSTLLAKELRELIPNVFGLFTYTVSQPDMTHFLDNWVKLEFHANERLNKHIPKQLSMAFDDCVASFDCRQERWTKDKTFPQTLSIDAESAQVVLPGKTLFVCGGVSQGNSAYLISGGSPQLQDNMLNSRSLPGLIFAPALRDVLIFGGKNETGVLACCERFDMKTRSFVQIADMHFPRWRFNPCWGRGLVYLCGGGCNSVEVYSLIVEAFTVLSLALPEGFGIDGGLSLSYGDQILLLSSTCKGYINLSTDKFSSINFWHYGLTQSLSSYKLQLKNIDMWSLSTPVLAEERVYFVNWNFDRMCVRAVLNDGPNTPSFKQFISE